MAEKVSIVGSTASTLMSDIGGISTPKSGPPSRLASVRHLHSIVVKFIKIEHGFWNRLKMQGVILVELWRFQETDFIPT